MAFCGYCGAQMPDDMRFCTECGKPLNRKMATASAVPVVAEPVKQPANQNEVEEPIIEPNSVVDNASGSMNGSNDNSVNFSEAWNQENIPEDAVRLTMSESDFSNSNNDKLYQSLKNANAQKAKTEKKKLILPLVLTLVFAGIAIAFAMIKLKPYEKWFSVKDEEVAENAVETETSETETDTSNNHEDTVSQAQAPSANSSNVATSSSGKYLEPEIVGADSCLEPVNQYMDTVTLCFFFEVYNPNPDVMVMSPQITYNLRTTSDTILATDTCRAGLIMPGDTIKMFGSLSVLKSEVDDYEYGDYVLEWGDFATESRFYSPIRTADIQISNVSARGTGYDTRVTGEIKNNSAYDISLPEVYAIFRKGDEIVAIESTYADSISAGGSRVFEVNCFRNIPNYDTVEIVVDAW